MKLDIEQKNDSYDKLDELSKDELTKLLKKMLSDEISIMFHGKKLHVK